MSSGLIDEKRDFIIKDLRDSALDAFCPQPMRRILDVRNAYEAWANEAYDRMVLLQERCPL